MQLEADTVADTRFAFGASCAWFGPIQAARPRNGVSCCPGCGGLLFTVDRAASFWNGLHQTDLARPGYLAFMKWVDAELRTGRHFTTGPAALSAYQRETGNVVPPERRHV